MEKLIHKIKSTAEAVDTIKQWQTEGNKVVFTNGCFDIVHYGHIHYLYDAAQLGDKLIVALNSSASVSRLKGNHRPINDDKTRFHLMAALEFVDMVLTFDQDTPLELITALVPDILVKGGDWAPKDIVGSDVVLNNGGEVKSLAFVDGFSTTLIEKKIKNS